jgi:hypothetical protein
VGVLMRIEMKPALSLLLAMSLNSYASDLIIVANTEQADITLNKRQVRDIFMGDNSQFLLKPIAMAPRSKSRYTFNTRVVGLTESRIQSYWAQMRFSGRKKAPREFDSLESLLVHLQNNKETVAYLPSDTKLPDGLIIVYEMN